MNKELRNLLFYEAQSKNMLHLLITCFLYPEIALQCAYRKAQVYTQSHNPLVKYFWKYKWLRIRKKSHCQVSLNADIGRGLRFWHDGPRLVVSGAKLGENCTLGINTVIGLNYPSSGGLAEFPTIGDRVYVGHNASIVGGVKIGNDVVIACNAFVNKDVPDHSIVVGNNTIIHQKNPSLRFLRYNLENSCHDQIT